MELLVFWVIFAVIVGVAANSRGRSGIGWFILAVLISPLLALIVLVVVPNLRDESGRVAPPAPPPAFAPTLRIPPEGLASWTRPDPDGPITRLDGGLELMVAHRVDNWAQVRASNGWEGWVDARRLVPFASAARPDPRARRT